MHKGIVNLYDQAGLSVQFIIYMSMATNLGFRAGICARYQRLAYESDRVSAPPY